ncbi:MAG: response regulator transcription factor [Chloroflexota bacterium]
MSKFPTRILLAEDQVVMAEGLLAMLSSETNFEVVAVAKDGQAAIDLYVEHKPDIILLDIKLPKISGIDVLREIIEIDAKAKVIMLSAYEQEEFIYQAFQFGAMAYVFKETLIDHLFETIAKVARGEKVLEGEVAVKFMQRSIKPALSDRELEVLTLVAEGNSNASVANLLHLSEGTIKIHIHNILKKMEVSDRTVAVVEGIRRGLIEID